MRQSNKRLFDEIAPTYDRVNHLFSVNIDRWWRNQAVQAITLSDTARILDVCTGTADVALAVARRHPASRIWGVDFSEVMLWHGRAKIARHRRQHAITLARANALALPFPAQTFEAVFISFGLRNLTDWQTGLREAERVLRPGGHLVILEFAPPPNTWRGQIFRWYLGRIMPVIGGLISKLPSAYHYLHASIEQFPEPAVIREFLREAHFQGTTCQRMIGGMVYLHIGQKTPLTAEADH